MTEYRAIRASFDAQTIVVYQAYSAAIGEPALTHQRFVPPFSLQRMTWIKPSFLWMMERSNWGQKAGQEVVLAVRIKRSGWEEALAMGVLSHPDKTLYASAEAWQADSHAAKVRIQWDPERSLRGGKLEYRSIQVGLGRQVIRQYAEEWVVGIEDMRPLVKRIHGLRMQGDHARAERLLPDERPYPLPSALARKIGCTTEGSNA